MKNKSIINIFGNKIFHRALIAILFVLPFGLFAQDGHEGHDHAAHPHGEEVTDEAAAARKISESSSSKYEAVISYTDIHSGEQATLNLFVSDVETNGALDSVTVKLTSPEINNQDIPLTKKQMGWYEFKVNFPSDGHYNFFVNITGSDGDGTLKLSDVEVGGHEHGLEEKMHAPHWYTNPWVTFLGGALLVIVILILARAMRNKKAMAVFAGVMLFTSQQTFSPTTLTAQDGHEGHDHGDGGAKPAAALTDQFAIPKETQFLFGILTSRINHDTFSPARKVFGRVIAAPDGFAEVHSPQAARMGTVNVTVGQRVSKGQLLATVELIPDAASQVTLLAALNEAKANYESAKLEVARLKTISDIASKKQQDEAKARLDIATENKKLLEAGGLKSFTLKSPIDGVVESFGLSSGASIKPEDVLFTVSNSQHILIEAQVYEDDLEAIQQAPNFTVQCSDKDHLLTDVKLLSIGQRLNTANQAQQVTFTVSNANGDLRIGESVSVFAYENADNENYFVPNSAMNEINGKPVVFVKESAETFRIVYVAAGRDNGVYTEILRGLNEGERVVTNGTYQVKMIFLNQ
ncbi:MAG: efflux RND transporter periplasmic adaptor subunit [Flavobacteriales bacterium]|nr:efflux RND transporter periplasmic adaptor subunit [Flavobacteriales bacterium]